MREGHLFRDHVLCRDLQLKEVVVSWRQEEVGLDKADLEREATLGWDLHLKGQKDQVGIDLEED